VIVFLDSSALVLNFHVALMESSLAIIMPNVISAYQVLLNGGEDVEDARLDSSFNLLKKLV
jgi:hypothetical protein